MDTVFLFRYRIEIRAHDYMLPHVQPLQGTHANGPRLAVFYGDDAGLRNAFSVAGDCSHCRDKALININLPSANCGAGIL